MNMIDFKGEYRVLSTDWCERGETSFKGLSVMIELYEARTNTNHESESIDAFFMEMNHVTQLVKTPLGKTLLVGLTSNSEGDSLWPLLEVVMNGGPREHYGLVGVSSIETPTGIHLLSETVPARFEAPAARHDEVWVPWQFFENGIWRNQQECVDLFMDLAREFAARFAARLQHQLGLMRHNLEVLDGAYGFPVPATEPSIRR